MRTLIRLQTFINATLELESAIQQYQRAEAKLGGAVTTISKKVDTINQHIDKVLENAPTKLKVAVNVNDADWQKMQQMFDVAKTEHSHPLGMVVSTHFRCGKGVKRGLKNGALPFNID